MIPESVFPGLKYTEQKILKREFPGNTRNRKKREHSRGELRKPEMSVRKS